MIIKTKSTYRSVRNNLLILSLIAFALAVIVVVFGFLEIQLLQIVVSIEVLILLLFWSIPVISDIRHQRLQPFEPVHIISALFLFFFCIPGLSSVFIEPVNFYYNSTTLPMAFLFVLFCYTAFLIGYYIVPRRMLVDRPSCTKQWNINKVPIVIVLLMFIGIVFSLYRISAGNYFQSGVGGTRVPAAIGLIVTNLSGFSLVAVYLAAIYYYYVRNEETTKHLVPVARSLLVLAFLFEMVYMIPRGSKRSLILPVIMVLAGYSFVRKSIPYRGILLTFLLIVMVIFPLVTIYRNSFGYVPSASSTLNIESSTILEASNITFQQMTSMSVVEVFSFGYRGVMRRMNMLDPVNRVMEYVPGIVPYAYGKTYSLFFAGLIPRALWPGKPILSHGAEFGHLFEMVHPSDTRTSAAITLVGEAYYNFGFAGFAVMFVVGIIFKNFYRELVERSNNGFVGLLLFFPILMASLKVTGVFYEFTTAFQQMIFLLPFAYLLKSDGVMK